MQDLSAISPLPITISLHTVLLRALDRLQRGGKEGAPSGPLADLLERAIEAPAQQEARYLLPALKLGLGPAEIIALSALVEVETDPAIGQQIMAVQGGRGTARPSVGTLAELAGMVLPGGVEACALLQGPLFALPLARLLSSPEPSVLAPVGLTEAMLAALGLPAQVRFCPPPLVLEPPESYRKAARQVMARVGARRTALVLRGGLLGDLWLFARALAEADGRPLADLTGLPERVSGLGPAILFRDALPIEEISVAAGGRGLLRALDAFEGPRLALLVGDGAVLAPGWDAVDLLPPALSGDERRAIWREAGGSDAPEGPRSGLGPARLAALAARMALTAAAGDPSAEQRRAAAAEARPDIEPQGRQVGAVVRDDALIASDEVRRGLELLAARCRQRRNSRDTLGPAFRAQQVGTGVRALLSGPSGSGKTFAAAWLATKLGMPLFRIDLSTVVSKYIGETEENLARILDRAEAADVILLFDEADSLFGSRTEVKDSSDRFANNQTNYLLSRIESYGGIVLMTTNARQRLDSAFSRRIEQIIEVPIPDASARRAIWLAHLGRDHDLSGADLNHLAASADIAGGHIRTITLTAAVMAEEAGHPIGMADIRRALVLEYHKIGRTPPANLVRG